MVQSLDMSVAHDENHVYIINRITLKGPIPSQKN